MPHRAAAVLTCSRAAFVLNEVVRRIDAVIPDEVELDELRHTLEIETGKGPHPFVALMRVGRHWVFDRTRRSSDKEVN